MFYVQYYKIHAFVIQAGLQVKYFAVDSYICNTDQFINQIFCNSVIYLEYGQVYKSSFVTDSCILKYTILDRFIFVISEDLFLHKKGNRKYL